MVTKLELFTGEILKLNKHGVWEIYSDEDSKVGYPIELIDVLSNLDKFIKERYFKKD